MRRLARRLRTRLLRALWSSSLQAPTSSTGSKATLPVEQPNVPYTLEMLIGTAHVASFLEESFSIAVTHFEGWPNKLRNLLPWEALNSIINYNELHFPDFKVVQNGRVVDQRSYIGQSGINHTALPGLLAEGATIVVNSIDRYYPPLRKLTVNCEALFRVPVQANAYVSFAEQPGFSMHQDGHDTLILQVIGKKHWSVYHPSVPFLLESKERVSANEIKGIAWEGTLHDGSVLHIPRGYPHLVTPLLEPSLHLTVTFSPRTGVDLLKWISESITSNAEVRHTVPQFASESKKKAWVASIRNEMIAAIDDSVVERYCNAVRTKIPDWTNTRLPNSVLEQVKGEARASLADK